MTQQTYVIRNGASFRLPDGTLKAGGEEIELDSDVAAMHSTKVDLKTSTVDADAASAAITSSATD